jgi:hypothetical protein
MRRMKHLLSAPIQQPIIVSEKETKPDYIHPPLAHYINAPLPILDSPDHLLGIYGNILYPQDLERMQEKRLADWIDGYGANPNLPFPLSQAEFKDLSLFILERFPSGLIASFFVNRVQHHLANGDSLQIALQAAKEETIAKAHLFKQIAKEIPNWGGQSSLLKHKLETCSQKLEQRLDQQAEEIQKNPDSLPSLVKKFSIDLIEAPFMQEQPSKSINLQTVSFKTQNSRSKNLSWEAI